MTNKRKGEENSSPSESNKKAKDDELSVGEAPVDSLNPVATDGDLNNDQMSQFKTLKTVIALLEKIHSNPMTVEPHEPMHKEIQNLRSTVEHQINKLFPHSQSPSSVDKTINSQRSAKHPRKTRYVPISMEDIFLKKPSTFYEILFEGDSKRSVDPFEIEESVRNTTSQIPLRTFSVSRNKVVVEMEHGENSKKITSVESVDGFACKVSPYNVFNTTRGLIYTKHIDFSREDSLPSFKEWLAKNWKVDDVSLAPFITPRDGISKALVVNFRTNDLPYNIYIPGEEYDTKVYPFHNRPMKCSNCQNYGHTNKRCRSEIPVCKRCSLPGHKSDECSPDAVVRCHHCGDSHEAGSRICSRYIREATILKIQLEQKVSLKRAMQIERGENLNTFTRSETYPDILEIKMSETDKKQFNPWLLDKCLSNIGGKIKNIRSVNSQTYSIETESQAQCQEILSLTLLNKKPISVTPSKHFDPPKGLAYIYEYNLCRFETFKGKLIERLPIKDIVIASWIKSNRTDSRAVPILISFDQIEVPNFINIPGEQALTKVYEYKTRPMLCKQCLDFGHTLKRCRNMPRCRKCTSTEHKSEECTAHEPTCRYCDIKHITGNQKCREVIYEQEILSVQSKKRVPRTQAKLLFDKENPHFKDMNFGEAVMRSQVPTTNQENTSSQYPQSEAGASHAPLNVRSVIVPSTPTTSEVFQDDDVATMEMFADVNGGSLDMQSYDSCLKRLSPASAHNLPHCNNPPELKIHTDSSNEATQENAADQQTYELELKRSRKAKSNKSKKDKSNKSKTSTQKRDNQQNGDRSRSPQHSGSGQRSGSRQSSKSRQSSGSRHHSRSSRNSSDSRSESRSREQGSH